MGELGYIRSDVLVMHKLFTGSGVPEFAVDGGVGERVGDGVEHRHYRGRTHPPGNGGGGVGVFGVGGRRRKRFGPLA